MARKKDNFPPRKNMLSKSNTEITVRNESNDIQTENKEHKSFFGKFLSPKRKLNNSNEHINKEIFHKNIVEKKSSFSIVTIIDENTEKISGSNLTVSKNRSQSDAGIEGLNYLFRDSSEMNSHRHSHEERPKKSSKFNSLRKRDEKKYENKNSIKRSPDDDESSHDESEDIFNSPATVCHTISLPVITPVEKLVPQPSKIVSKSHILKNSGSNLPHKGDRSHSVPNVDFSYHHKGSVQTGNDSEVINPSDSLASLLDFNNHHLPTSYSNNSSPVNNNFSPLHSPAYYNQSPSQHSNSSSPGGNLQGRRSSLAENRPTNLFSDFVELPDIVNSNTINIIGELTTNLANSFFGPD